MATLIIGVESGYRWLAPTSDAGIVEVGKQYVAHESSLDPANRLILPALADVSAALALAQGGLEDARREEARRAVAATEFHRLMAEATPLLSKIFDQLKWQHRDNLSRLQQYYNLKTKMGASGNILVTKPRTEPEWADFLSTLVTYQETLPVDQRLLVGDFLPLKGLAAAVPEYRLERTTATSARKLGIETRTVTSGPLLDLLQLAFGLLVVTRFERRVTTALEPWGFIIQAVPAKPSATPPEPATPPVEPGAPA